MKLLKPSVFLFTIFCCIISWLPGFGQHRLIDKLPDEDIRLFNIGTNLKSPEDTSYCSLYSDYDNIMYPWKCPQPDYGDDIYAQRFDGIYNKRLSSAELLLYDNGNPEVFYDSGFYLIVFDVAPNGKPGNELMRYKVPAGDIILYPDTMIVNFYDSTIIASDLFIGVQGVENAPGYILLISSDDDPSGEIRSYSRWTQPDTSWVSIEEGWGINVNFSLSANFCFNPRTIRVPEDFPNIKSAVFAATEGDTVLVNNGTYYGTDNFGMSIGYESVIIKSVNGPAYTTINAQGYAGYSFISFYGSTPTYQLFAEIDGFTFRNFQDNTVIDFSNNYAVLKNSVFYDNSISYGSTVCVGGADEIFNCTFFNNTGDGSSTIVETGSYGVIENTIFAYSVGAKAIAHYPTGIIDIGCTNIYGNEGGDWIDNIKDNLQANGNISVDPMFCDTNANRNLHINEGSFCNPLHPLNSCGELIGYYDVNCTGCTDTDIDGICNETDNCLSNYNPLQEDSDFDFTGDVCDFCPYDEFDDADGDGFCADIDNCPTIYNPLQSDPDGDLIGSLCDLCPDVYDPEQLDLDEDGLGDACEDCPDDPDNDLDADGFCLLDDNCPTTYNPNQTDIDADGVGDLCDNCPTVYDPTLADADNDGIGDLCDECTDTDNDGFGNPGYPLNSCPEDNCPGISNPLQEDYDLDGEGDVCDGCVDTDNDGYGNPGFTNPLCPISFSIDNCPNIYNPDQLDSDFDSIGDSCDNCPTVTNYYQNDNDSDLIGNLCDNCIDLANPDQIDTDNDGRGDACDGCCLWLRGNVDNDPNDYVDIADLVYFVNYSFGNPQGPAPVCIDEANVDNIAGLDIADIVFLARFMFSNGETPVVCP
ncbi:MAG: hypothetical protein DWP97_08655 [Calditrichaeota bacterium]|nr:MAG: hypothetical protein DWP97_08655 [Calditrichota bacterium]